jgi:hypothetical protein
VKLPTTLFIGLLAALMLVAGLPLLTAAQTSGRKNPDLVISSMAGRGQRGGGAPRFHGAGSPGSRCVQLAVVAPTPKEQPADNHERT